MQKRRQQADLVARLNQLGGFCYYNFYCTSARIKRSWWLFGRGQIAIKTLCTDEFTSEWQLVDDETAELILEEVAKEKAKRAKYEHAKTTA